MASWGIQDSSSSLARSNAGWRLKVVNVSAHESVRPPELPAARGIDGEDAGPLPFPPPPAADVAIKDPGGPPFDRGDGRV